LCSGFGAVAGLICRFGPAWASLGRDWALARCVIGQRGKQTQTKPAGEETSQQNCQLSEKCALGNKAKHGQKTKKKQKKRKKAKNRGKTRRKCGKAKGLLLLFPFRRLLMRFFPPVGGDAVILPGFGG